MREHISVLLVDDHAVVRAGFKTLLSLSNSIGSIYEAEKGESACQLYSQYNPDVVVLDLSMPGIGGLETIRRLISRDMNSKILVFSIHNELVFVIRALKAGAKGYITKNSGPEILVSAVGKIAQGGSYVEAELAQQLAINMGAGLDDSDRIGRLSPREFDVFCLLANGYSTHKTAETLCLNYKTVCNHGTAIKEKLEITSIAEMTLIATRQGLIKLYEGSPEN
ncbi:MAG: response regulator transcription factor [Methylococcaceae bacterium]|jgi:DNA-binding NarL/FixJ family response regulator